MNYLIFLASMVLASSAWAQQMAVIYRDDYSNNNNRWAQSPAGGYEEFLIKDGVYSINRRIAGQDQTLFNKVFIDYKGSFDIEMKVRISAGDPNSSVGIVWGASENRHLNIASISNNGKYGIFVSSNGVIEKVIDFTPNDAIKVNDWNTVVVKQRGSALTLVVNGITVQSFVDVRAQGFEFGFHVSGRMAAQVDYIEIRQNLPPINLAPNHPVNVQRENLGPKVNCSGGDLAPVVTAKGNRLYFGRYPWKENIGNPDLQDVYYTDLQKDGTWGIATNIGRPINNETSNYVVSVTPDENSMILGNTYYPNGYPKGPGLSMSVRTATGWSVPEDIHIENYYNNNRFAEMCLDPSGTVLILSVERLDGFGNKDLYVCFKRPNGTFSKPLNCGPTLNTMGMDFSPFMAADGQTLYFATDGRRGYGNADIFMSRRLDDTWTNWSEPLNLGPVVNTPQWDAYYTVPAKGDYAYLCGDNGVQTSDIYRVKLSEGVRPKPVVLVSGNVLDAKTKQPIAARVSYEKLTTNKSAGQARSVLPEGSYAISLPAGDLYGFRAEAPGYYPISDQLDTRSITAYSELKRNLFLAPIEKDVTVVLNNLFFDSGLALLRPESSLEIQRLVEFLKENTGITIELSGHTDNVGAPAANLLLSQKRVAAVEQELLRKGIPQERVRAVGYGEKRPKASNSTENGRQRNRRVEFRIINM
jgi:outer membrane protein OmpA-like peptidoglycan-associated protein